MRSVIVTPARMRSDGADRRLDGIFDECRNANLLSATPVCEVRSCDRVIREY